MGDEMKATRELKGLKEEMEALAEILDGIDTDLDSTVVADIIQELADGKTAEYLVERYGLDAEEGGV